VSISEERDNREPRPDEVRIVDLHAQVCRNDEMIQDVGVIEVLRSDGIRFSRPGADWLAQWLGPSWSDAT